MMIEINVKSDPSCGREVVAFFNINKIPYVTFNKSLEPGKISSSIEIDNDYFRVTEEELERVKDIVRNYKKYMVVDLGDPKPLLAEPVGGINEAFSKEAEVYEISARRNRDDDLIALTVFFKDKLGNRYFSIDVTKGVLEKGYLSIKSILYNKYVTSNN